MRTTAVAVLVAGALAGVPTLSAAASDSSATAASTAASSYCRTLHRHHPAVYHHRFGRGARAFPRCMADWQHHHHVDRHHHGGHHHNGGPDD